LRGAWVFCRRDNHEYKSHRVWHLYEYSYISFQLSILSPKPIACPTPTFSLSQYHQLVFFAPRTHTSLILSPFLALSSSSTTLNGNPAPTPNNTQSRLLPASIGKLALGKLRKREYPRSLPQVNGVLESTYTYISVITGYLGSNTSSLFYKVAKEYCYPYCMRQEATY
jgi:hypothetical protein